MCHLLLPKLAGWRKKAPNAANVWKGHRAAMNLAAWRQAGRNGCNRLRAACMGCRNLMPFQARHPQAANKRQAA